MTATRSSVPVAANKSKHQSVAAMQPSTRELAKARQLNVDGRKKKVAFASHHTQLSITSYLHVHTRKAVGAHAAEPGPARQVADAR